MEAKKKKKRELVESSDSTRYGTLCGNRSLVKILIITVCGMLT